MTPITASILFITSPFQNRKTRYPFVIILLLFKVLASIYFDHQLSAHRAEIHDVLANGILTAEMDAIHAMGTQPCPEPGFCLGLFVT